MWVKPTSTDARHIAYYTGVLAVGISLAMCVPLATALVFGEWAASLDYVLGIGVGLAAGGLLMATRPRRGTVDHRHALVISALGWLVAALIGAVPLAFSGNYHSYLDALFDAMSGFTTSGLTVVVDLDHMANAHNMWRHLTHLIGGQGIIVAALSLAVGLRGGAFSLYVAEGRDEKILPNVMHTARFIWLVTAVFVALGTSALLAVNLFAGMAPDRSLLHAFWITIAVYDTGGFAPQALNALYYHSWAFEAVTMVLMIAGGINFNLHAAVWRGDRREMARNIETRMLAANIVLLTVITALALAASAAYGTPSEVIRKGVYHVVSAHTGTGHQTLHPAAWESILGAGATFAVVLAMGFGASVSSTAGGIKAMRVALVLKSIYKQVKQSLSPASAVVRVRYHHLRDRELTSRMATAALTVTVLYVLSYVTGGLIGAAYGYSPLTALFESVSATANVGLSAGITSASMPAGLKILYILQMWTGRLEFVAFFVLVAGVVVYLMSRMNDRRPL